MLIFHPTRFTVERTVGGAEQKLSSIINLSSGVTGDEMEVEVVQNSSLLQTEGTLPTPLQQAGKLFKSYISNDELKLWTAHHPKFFAVESRLEQLRLFEVL